MNKQKTIHMRDQNHRARHLDACYDPHCMDGFGIADSIAPMKGAVNAGKILLVIAVVTATFFYFFV